MKNILWIASLCTMLGSTGCALDEDDGGSPEGLGHQSVEAQRAFVSVSPYGGCAAWTPGWGWEAGIIVEYSDGGTCYTAHDQVGCNDQYVDCWLQERP